MADSLKRKLRDIIAEAKVPPRQEIYEEDEDEEDEDEERRKGRAKPDTALRPDKLSLEFTPDEFCLLYTSPSPRDKRQSRMPSSA